MATLSAYGSAADPQGAVPKKKTAAKKPAKKQSLWGKIGSYVTDAADAISGRAPANTATALAGAAAPGLAGMSGGQYASDALDVAMGRPPSNLAIGAARGVAGALARPAPAAAPATVKHVSAVPNMAAPQPTIAQSYGFPQAPGAPQLGAVGMDPEYLAVLRGAQQQQSTALEESYRPIFEELAKRETASRAAVASLPERYATQYDRGRGALTDAAAQATQQANAVAPVSMQSIGMTGTEGITPFQSAMTTLQADRNADVPLVGAGLDQYIGAQRSSVQQQKATAAQDLQNRMMALENDYRLEAMRQSAENQRASAGYAAGERQAIIGQQAQTAGALQEQAQAAQLQRDLAAQDQSQSSLGNLAAYGKQLQQSGEADAQHRNNPATVKRMQGMSAEVNALVTAGVDYQVAVAQVASKYRSTYPKSVALWVYDQTG